MGRWKAFLPIMLALVVAVAGSLFTYKWVMTQVTPKETVQVAVRQESAVPVVVAAVGLPWGTKLKAEMLKTVPYLKESLPPGYCSLCNNLEGRVLIAPVRAQEPILDSKLAPVGITSGGVSAVVSPGKRAVAVKGNEVIGIAGFIMPGNRVDVLVTLTDPKNKKEITKTVLENVMVLATGTQVEESPEGKPAPFNVYTLEVDPHESERLALAATGGRLQFALRNAVDAETVLTKGADIQQTLKEFREKETEVQQKVHTVEIIKEGKVMRQRLAL